MRPSDYKDLINMYLAKQISVDHFYERFNVAFRKEPAGLDDDLFRILDTMWGTLEVYSPRASPGYETPFLISEETLRTRMAAVLARLDSYLASS